MTETWVSQVEYSEDSRTANRREHERDGHEGGEHSGRGESGGQGQSSREKLTPCDWPHITGPRAKLKKLVYNVTAGGRSRTSGTRGRFSAELKFQVALEAANRGAQFAVAEFTGIDVHLVLANRWSKESGQPHPPPPLMWPADETDAAQEPST